MTKASHRFFSNKDCTYFPCHAAGDSCRAADGTEDFNCLFCYCPLYFIPQCGGNPRYLESGVKDCSACLRPHCPEAYDGIVDTLRKHINAARKTGAEAPRPADEADPRA